MSWLSTLGTGGRRFAAAPLWCGAFCRHPHLSGRPAGGRRAAARIGCPTLCVRLRGGLADPWPRGAVVDLGFGAQPFEDAERMAVTRQAGNFARGIVEVAEYDGCSRAGLHAGGHIFAGTQFAAANSRGAGAGGVQTAVAEVALLDYATHARRHVRIESLLHAGWPLRVPPVEVAGVIRAGCHAVAAAEAALRHLIHDAGGGIDFDSLLRADRGAGRSLPALLAKDGDEGGTAIGKGRAVGDLIDAHPGDARAGGGLGHHLD